MCSIRDSALIVSGSDSSGGPWEAKATTMRERPRPIRIETSSRHPIISPDVRAPTGLGVGPLYCGDALQPGEASARFIRTLLATHRSQGAVIHLSAGGFHAPPGPDGPGG